MIYDQNKIIIDHIFKEFNNNKLQSTINFATEKEQREPINFLVFTIHRKDKNLQFSIYQKPIKTA